jgi:hypothetical protein
MRGTVCFGIDPAARLNQEFMRRTQFCDKIKPIAARVLSSDPAFG